MRQWLPLPTIVFDTIVTHLPNPMKGYLNKEAILFPPSMVNHHNYPILSDIDKIISQNINGNTTDENALKTDDHQNPVLAYISKMVAIPKKNLSNNKITIIDSKQDDTQFMAFARNYCGTIKKGHEYYVIGPKHDPKSNNYYIKKFKFDNLYIFMGQYLESVEEVPPGNIFSVSGLENHVFKTATISSVFDCPTIISSNFSVY